MDDVSIDMVMHSGYGSFSKGYDKEDKKKLKLKRIVSIGSMNVNK